MACCCRCLVAQSCLTLCHPMGCSPPGSSVHGILQARILEGVAMFSSKRFSQPKYRTWIACISCTAGGFFYHWAMGKAWNLRGVYMLWYQVAHMPTCSAAREPHMGLQVGFFSFFKAPVKIFYSTNNTTKTSRCMPKLKLMSSILFSLTTSWVSLNSNIYSSLLHDICKSLSEVITWVS